jgi:hypothetical protein
VSTLVIAGVPGRVRSLSVPPMGQDEGDVVWCRKACGEGREERSWPTLTLVLGPGSRSLAGPWSFRLIPACVLWAVRVAN